MCINAYFITCMKTFALSEVKCNEPCSLGLFVNGCVILFNVYICDTKQKIKLFIHVYRGLLTCYNGCYKIYILPYSNHSS